MIWGKTMGKPWENHANPPGNPKFHGPGTGAVRPTSVGPGPSGGSLAAELPLPGGCRVSSRPSEAQASGALGREIPQTSNQIQKVGNKNLWKSQFSFLRKMKNSVKNGTHSWKNRKTWGKKRWKNSRVSYMTWMFRSDMSDLCSCLDVQCNNSDVYSTLGCAPLET